jgi:tryptophan synthase beta chain
MSAGVGPSGAAGGAGGSAGVEERFGAYGGRFVPEVLIAALDELTLAWAQARAEPAYRDQLDRLLRDFVGRPTPLYLAAGLSGRIGRRVYLKREDLAHTGAHKINNAVGQALLAKRMGKQRVIAETGAGQHGVAAATACALLDLECVVYMGTEDMRRQAPNVERMRLLGARVAPVEAGARTLKEAVSAAIRDWVASVETTHYIIGSAVGPAPYPALVRDLQRVIGDEARAQALDAEGALPARVIACVGGGSNAIGTFTAFVNDPAVELIGVEAGGEGLGGERHGASLSAGRTGVLHGALTSVLADEDGQILEAHSVSAGLDYPGVGPEHAYLRDIGRVRYEAVTDERALDAFRELARLEGIIPALEPSHAIAWLLDDAGRPSEEAPAREAEERLDSDPGSPGREAEQLPGFDILTLSGRGDKDLAEVVERLGDV